MGETSDEILDHIESQRDQLGANLNELESRVRQTTDWRTHFDNNPYLMVGIAVGGGLLLGGLVSGNSHSNSRRLPAPSSGSSNWSGSSSPQMGIATSYQRDRANEALDNIKGALIAFALSKGKELLNDVLPGFETHLKETESKRSAALGNFGKTEHSTDYGVFNESRNESANQPARGTSEAGSIS